MANDGFNDGHAFATVIVGIVTAVFALVIIAIPNMQCPSQTERFAGSHCLPRTCNFTDATEIIEPQNDEFIARGYFLIGLATVLGAFAHRTKQTETAGVAYACAICGWVYFARGGPSVVTACEIGFRLIGDRCVPPSCGLVDRVVVPPDPQGKFIVFLCGWATYILALFTGVVWRLK